jgi:hypothetical protein
MRNLIAVLAAGLLAASARADPILQIVSHSVTLDFADRTALFDVVFNRAPDFHTLDSVGRQADAFWFDIDTDDRLSTGLFADWYDPDLGIDRRIISENGDSSLHLHEGAFGPLLTTIPFELTGTEVRFSAGFDALGVPEGTARFNYALVATEYGATTQQIVVVPLPRAFLAAPPLLIALVASRARLRRARV